MSELRLVSPIIDKRLSWTDEKIAELKRFWDTGLSASKIAIEMGGGLTRNAIIGKATRLGLPGRSHPARKYTDEHVVRMKELCDRGMLPKKIAETLWEEFKLNVSPGSVSNKLTHIGCGALPKPQRPKPVRVRRLVGCGAGFMFVDGVIVTEAKASDPAGVPVEQRKTLGQLEPRSCRWPYGEPTSSEFFYCGAASHEKLPYCPFHCVIAYAAPGRRTEKYYPKFGVRG